MSMIQITENEYIKIKMLEELFYYGVEKYCNDLQDTWDIEQNFARIIKLIDNARGNK
jgi:hypothetical protein